MERDARLLFGVHAASCCGGGPRDRYDRGNILPVEYGYKIVMAGEQGVGKTSLLRRFVDDAFDEDGKALPFTFQQKKVQLDNEKEIQVQLWDLERTLYADVLIPPIYYRGAKGIIIVFDTDDPEALERLDKWAEQITKSTDGIPVLLIGNKIDITVPSGNFVSECENFADKYGFMVEFASAKTGENVKEAFMAIVHLAHEEKKIEDQSRGMISEPIRLG